MDELNTTERKRLPGAKKVIFVIACIFTVLTLVLTVILGCMFFQSNAIGDGWTILAVIIFMVPLLAIEFIAAALGTVFSAIAIRSRVKHIKVASIVLCILNGLMTLPPIITLLLLIIQG